VVADFTTWVTNPFSFLAQPPVFRAELHAAQALPGNAYQLLHYDTVLEDPYGGWSATATPNQPIWSWLCPAGCAGWYEVTTSGFTQNQGTTTGEIAMVLFLNGAIWQYASDDWPVSGSDSGTSGSLEVPLVPGDYVQMLLWSTTAVSTPGTAGQFPSVELAWVSS
jgi:hypothetical protein